MRKVRGRWLYRRGDDGRLVVVVTSRRKGIRRRRQRTLWHGATLADGQRVGEQLRIDLVGANQNGRIPLLSEYVPVWLARKRPKWRAGASTYRDACTILDRHVLPVLGRVRIDQLRPRLRPWLDLQAGGAEPATVLRRWQLLRSVVKYACADYGLPDPVYGIPTPKLSRHDARQAVSRREAQALVAAAAASRPKWAPLVLLGYATGARPSELLACRLDDLDLPKRTWRIVRHLGSAGGGVVLPGTKTSKHGRVAVLAPSDADYLAGILKGRRKGLMVSDQPSRPASHSSLGKALTALCRLSGLRRVTGKTFRQSWVTWARAQGVADTVIGHQLGHTTGYVTDRYERRDQADQIAAMEDGWLI